ncbi:AMP-binding protein [Gordonia bronchialis]|uniref:AMP-binding protein n=1 Tax=Gordonia bronchialis TaxID=2054 RepID=UPI0024301DDC|nr:AMP-binding protein [Gordonia bronchialis]
MKVAPWPPNLVERYRDLGLWSGHTFDDVLRSRAQEPGSEQRLAVIDAERRLTYRDLDDRVSRLAAGLMAAGIGPEDRVVVQIPNRVGYVEAVFALFRLGAIPVFTLPAHRESELVPITRAAGAVSIISPCADPATDFRALAETVMAQVDSVGVLIDADDLEAHFADPVEHRRSDPGELAFLQRPRCRPARHRLRRPHPWRRRCLGGNGVAG